MRGGRNVFSGANGFYGAFFPCFALTCAHLARCAAAILRRAASDIVRFAGLALLVGFNDPGCDPFFTRAHRALCA
jgi:class 3 adenylate cyclase